MARLRVHACPNEGRSLFGIAGFTVSVSPQKQAASEALAGPVPFAGGIRFAEKLVLLTHDESLTEALASVVPPESLLVVADEAALASQLLSGHAGVVFIDVATHSQPAAALAQRLHVEFASTSSWSWPVTAPHKASWPPWSRMAPFIASYTSPCPHNA